MYICPYASLSIDIDKVRVLRISHIRECGRIDSIRWINTTCSHGLTQLLFLAVFPDESVTEDEEEGKLQAICYQKRTDAQVVRRCLFTLVEEGTSNVPQAGTEPNHP